MKQENKRILMICIIVLSAYSVPVIISIVPVIISIYFNPMYGLIILLLILGIESITLKHYEERITNWIEEQEQSEIV